MRKYLPFLVTLVLSFVPWAAWLAWHHAQPSPTVGAPIMGSNVDHILGRQATGQSTFEEHGNDWVAIPDGGTAVIWPKSPDAVLTLASNESLDESLLVRLETLDASACGDTGNCDGWIRTEWHPTYRGGVMVSPVGGVTSAITGNELGSLLSGATASLVQTDAGTMGVSVACGGQPCVAKASISYNRAQQYNPAATPAVVSVSQSILATVYTSPITLTITTTTGAATGATAATYDGVALTSVTPISSSQLTAVLPAGTRSPTSPGAVSVTSPLSPSSCLACGQFAQSAVLNVSPSTGPTTGGTSTTISLNAGATGATAAALDGVACSSFSVTNDTTISCTSGAGSAGTGNVSVTSPSAPTSGGSWTYNTISPPTLASISPPTGNSGVPFTATGTNFVTPMTACFGGSGGSACTGGSSVTCTVSSSTVCTGTTPSLTASTTAVSTYVTNGGGASSGVNFYADSYGSGSNVFWVNASVSSPTTSTWIDISGAGHNMTLVPVAITNVTSSGGLIEITASNHGLLTGNGAIISGVVGVSAANATWNAVTVIDSSHFTLNGSTFSGSYSSGGSLMGTNQNWNSSGVAALRTNGSTQYGTAAIGTFAQPYTVCLASQVSSWPTLSFLFDGNGSSGARATLFPNDPGSVPSLSAYAGTEVDFSVSGNASLTNNPRFFCLVSVSGSSSIVYVSGTALSTTANIGTDSLTNLTIASNYNQTTTTQGFVYGEIFVVNAALNTTQLGINYTNHKAAYWGSSL